MAFENRDWMRPRSQSRIALPQWSVTTWIIVICVTVFVLDGFLEKKIPGWMFVGSTDLNGQPLSSAQSSQVKKGGPIKSLSLTQLDPRLAPLLQTASKSIPFSDPNIGVEPLQIENEMVGFAWFQATSPLQAWLHFSTSTALWSADSPPGRGLELWRFVGFQFLHANLNHLLFNMMALYFFGPIVERYLGGKRYLAFYLICGMAGATMYLLLNFLGIQFPNARIPFVLPNDPTTPLVGASAGIFGVIMAAAFLAPTAQVLLFFVLPMPLRTLAYALVGIALLTIFFGFNNAGGEAGHLGGAIAGYWFIRHPDSLHGLLNLLGNADPTSRTRKLKASKRRDSGPDAATIDRILDKIRKGGLQALNDNEREILRAASRKQ